MDRRTFIKSAAAGAGLLAAGPANKAFGGLLPSATTLLRRPKTPIEHVVVLMMENRSVDHYLGWWGDDPATDFDASTSHSFVDPVTGETHGLDHWGAGAGARNGGHGNYTGCHDDRSPDTGHYSDPGHGNWHGFVQLQDHDGLGGGGDGWLQPGSGNDEFALSTYTGDDLPVIRAIAQNFTAFDGYHCAWMGNTYPNRHYMHAATAYGVWDNRFPFQDPDNETLWWEWPTVWDVCLENQVTCAYYYSNVPFSAMYGPKSIPITRHIANFWAEAASGQLPQVSFVDPWFVAPQQPGANDDHPHADIRAGQEFLSNIVTSLMLSPAWESTALFITYDEWGGFYDHVHPPRVADPHATDYDPFASEENRARYAAELERRSGTQSRNELDLDFGQLGPRVPTFLVSPHARAWSTEAGRSVHTVLDHTSILGFIADNWALPNPGLWFPNESRTVLPGVMDGAFDFANPNPDVDVTQFVYVAPPEARIPCEGRQTYFDLWDMANEIEDMGFRVHTRVEDALP